MTYISTSETISTSGAEAPPLHLSKYQFGNGQRIVVSQGGSGISFPIEDAVRIAEAIQHTAQA